MALHNPHSPVNATHPMFLFNPGAIIYRFLVLLVIVCYCSPLHAQLKGQKLIDSLQQQLAAINDNKLKTRIRCEMAKAYYAIDPVVGIRVGNEALKEATKRNDKELMAMAHRAIGLNYLMQYDFVAELDHFEQALQLSKACGNKRLTAAVLGNIGIAYDDQSNYPLALDYYLKALRMYEALQDNDGILTNLSNIGLVYTALNDEQMAFDYCQKALHLSERINNQEGIAGNLHSLGVIYLHRGQYEQVIRFNERALAINKRSNNKLWQSNNLSTLGLVAMKQQQYEKALQYLHEALQLSKEIDAQLDISIYYAQIGETYTAFAGHHAGQENNYRGGKALKALRTAETYIDSAIQIAHQLNDFSGLKSYYAQKSTLEERLGRTANAFDYFRRSTEYKDSLFNQEKDKKLTQVALQYEFDKKTAAAASAQAQKDIRQKNIRNSIILGFGISLLFLLVVYRQRNKIAASKKQSDVLLLNILPEEVAEELKSNGSTEAKLMDSVTVLFTDFKGFTQLAEKLSPNELVAEINECFSSFDLIMEKHGVEKIKTIGDAYMATGGLPTPNQTHPRDVVRAAIDIREFMKTYKAERDAAGKLAFEIRIGIHTGPVVAGVVGVRKFAYDIWGDTVNTASRMESSGEPGRINISEATYLCVKHQFACEHRGKIAAKGKGNIDMYFVQHEIPA